MKVKAAGVIVYKKEKTEIKFLMLRHQNGVYWKFPSGHVESDDADEMDAALRELSEETGINERDIVFNRDFKENISYHYESDNPRYGKKSIDETVIFFLAETKVSEIKMSAEHSDWGWFDFETAQKRAYFQEQQDLLKKARNFLLSNENILL
ncbi:NUDIX domain-containing protein [Candidatus Parcubacteria bacterium]|nr:MAG: NUDIX domain-containing protein [Candidatus Parcubacteria bacterium]